jgi:hypothetical protein
MAQKRIGLTCKRIPFRRRNFPNVVDDADVHAFILNARRHDMHGVK